MIMIMITISNIDSMNYKDKCHSLVAKYLFLFHTNNMIYHRFHENLSIMRMPAVISDPFIYLSQTRTMK